MGVVRLLGTVRMRQALRVCVCVCVCVLGGGGGGGVSVTKQTTFQQSTCSYHPYIYFLLKTVTKYKNDLHY